MKQNFFDPNARAEILIPMYGNLHLIILLSLPVLVLLLLWKREWIERLVANSRIMTRLMAAYLLFEMVFLVVLWVFRYEPFYDRFPLQLCATLSILLPVLIILKKTRWLQFFSYWAISAGFISFANPSFEHVDPWSFDFIHYMIRHYFLFLMPIILQIGLGYKQNYRNFLVSLVSLAGWAIFIFLIDWVLGVNYMYLGKNSILEIPFLPASFTVWPWVLPSFTGVGIILLHLAYFSFGLLGREEQTAINYRLEKG